MFGLEWLFVAPDAVMSPPRAVIALLMTSLVALNASLCKIESVVIERVFDRPVAVLSPI